VFGTRKFLLSLQAVRLVHNPANLDVAEAARVRLAFDELLFMQLTLLVRRALSRCGRRAVAQQDCHSTAHRLSACCLFICEPDAPQCHCSEC